MSVYHVVLGLMLSRCTIIINLNFICLLTFPLVSLIDVERYFVSNVCSTTTLDGTMRGTPIKTQPAVWPFWSCSHLFFTFV
jgi:hypothetical protein